MTHGSNASLPIGQQTLTSSTGAAPKWISLRTKGLLAFGALIIYAAVVSVIVLHQKDQVLGQVAELQRVYKLEEVLRRVNLEVFHTVIVVNNVIYLPEKKADFQGIDFGLKLIQDTQAELAAEMPALTPALEGLNQSLAAAGANPSHANLIELAQKLNQMVTKLAEFTQQLRQREAALTRQYRLSSDSVVMTALLLGLLGLVLFGAIIVLFFTRLIFDLHTLKARAVEIVKGYRGEALPVTRHDEVGELMEAVNHMAADIEEHEKQLAIERQKFFHQEKMAAIGSLAAGVAHEIGNPIAAISGLAQAMDDAQRQGTCPNPNPECHPDLILSQTFRLSQITRQISDFATPHKAERELLDLNELIRSTSTLIRYDRRFRHIELQLNLDSQLPAVYCVGDQIIQVMMNLLINAADAGEGASGRAPRITVTTNARDGKVSVTVEDNGCGMDEQTLRRAMDPFFTTKPTGKGTGLGLALCKSIAEAHRGELHIESAPNAGTRVRLTLPPGEEELIREAT